VTSDETTVLLGFIQGIDRRIILDERAVSSWRNVLPEDMTLEEAMGFVRDHYREHEKSVLPAHLVGRHRISKSGDKQPLPVMDHECEGGYILIEEERNGQTIIAAAKCPQCRKN
jgi:hypothetical protein